MRLPRALKEWTRYFNLHSRKWMDFKYPQGVEWYIKQGPDRPIYFQKHQPDIPGSKVFPREEIQQFFATPKGPNRYFSCTVTWQIAFAIYEGFERIELWGFALSDSKPNASDCYTHERPCFFYWVKQARDRGIEVVYQPEVMKIPFVPGDPDTYDGLLYGYETKPEE